MSETVIHFCSMRSDCGDNYNYFDVLWIFDDRFAEDTLADGQINRYKDELYICYDMKNELLIWTAFRLD